MFFKRKEGFRFSFDNPIPAEIVILDNGRPADIERTRYKCHILDISPRGMKMFTEADFGVRLNQAQQIEIHFVLDMTDIVGVGEVMWEKPYGRGKQFGIVFYDQPSVEDLILNELKSRRRKEVNRQKSTLLKNAEK